MPKPKKKKSSSKSIKPWMIVVIVIVIILLILTVWWIIRSKQQPRFEVCDGRVTIDDLDKSELYVCPDDKMYIYSEDKKWGVPADSAWVESKDDIMVVMKDNIEENFISIESWFYTGFIIYKNNVAIKDENEIGYIKQVQIIDDGVLIMTYEDLIKYSLKGREVFRIGAGDEFELMPGFIITTKYYDPSKWTITVFSEDGKDLGTHTTTSFPEKSMTVEGRTLTMNVNSDKKTFTK